MSKETGIPGPKVHTQGKTDSDENLKTFLHYVRSGKFDIEFALGLKKQWNIPDTVLNSPEAKTAAIEGITKNLGVGNGIDAAKVKNVFALTPESLQIPAIEEAKRKGFFKALTSKSVRNAMAIDEAFSLPEDEKENMLIEAIEYNFRNWESFVSDEIVEQFNIPPEKMTDEIRALATEEFQSYISSTKETDREIALDIKSMYGLSDEIAPIPETKV